MKVVSVITICFNAVLDIEKTIQSVINQTFTSVEFIIVDGGSTDGTLQIIRKYENSIDVIISEPDNGIFDAMNKGLNAATGTWINFMNAGDCFYNSDVIESIFSKNDIQGVGVLYGSTFSNGTLRRPQKLNFLKYGGIMACHQSIFYNRIICGNEMYYKTKHKYYGDIELTRRLFIKGIKFRKVSIIIANFQGGGFSSQVSILARRAKFDYLVQNMGLIGIIYGLIGKIKYLLDKPNV
ncbi:glycosyltransferase family 2 protein [Cyclobacterium salsum]|uniref:glycosyltransferase family 2 protein n=1 Tax=Cyclobacterium salsum TaxID=2666329 RepID=UPI001391DD30|nr:glycosyltransferase family 2 protein [Cyclobacterium salsum]